MAVAETLAGLARRKETLVAAAEVERAALHVAMGRVSRPLRWLDQAERYLRPWRPLLLVAAPVGGFLLTRRWPGLVRWASRGLGAWGLGRRLWHFLETRPLRQATSPANR